MAVRLAENEREVANTVNEAKRNEGVLFTVKAELKQTLKKLADTKLEKEELQKKTTEHIDAKNRAQKEARDLKFSKPNGATVGAGGGGKQSSLDKKLLQTAETVEKVAEASAGGTTRSPAQLLQLEATFESALAEVRAAMGITTDAAGAKGAVNDQAKSRPAVSPMRRKPSNAPSISRQAAGGQGRPLPVSACAESLGSTTASSQGGPDAAQLAAAAQLRLQLAQSAGVAAPISMMAQGMQAKLAMQALQAPQAAPLTSQWSWPEEVVVNNTSLDTTVEGAMELPDTARGKEAS